MNLLVVTPSFPSPTWGGGTRNYYLLKTLARNHRVSLLTFIGNVEEGSSCSQAMLEEHIEKIQMIIHPTPSFKRLKQLISVVCGRSFILDTYFSVEVQDAIDVLLARDHYDVVIFESVLMAGYRLPKNVKVIIDQHNIEYEILWRTYQRETAWLRKWYSRLESHLVKPVEIERCRGADAVLVTSEREHVFLKRMLPGSVIRMVSNGVDTDAFHKNNQEQEIANQIIFTGAMSYYPNVDAVLFFAEKCWPLIRARVPAATWLIVGSEPLPEVQKLADLPGVLVTGSVPDVKPYLARSAVAIAPLLIGGGTRLKILEALAMQKAVVSTSLGSEGLSVVPGKHLILADEPDDFAQAVVTFLQDPEKRKAFGSAGRALVEAEYSWERSGEKLLHVLEEIL